jgi:hypothetical protein
MELCPLVLLFSLFFSSTLFAFRLLRLPYSHPAGWVGGYLIFWVSNIFIAYSSTHLPFKLSLTTPALILVLISTFTALSNVWTRKKLRYLFLYAALLLPGLYFYTVPLSDTDSISYVLPMVDTGLSQHHLGTSESFNFRANSRFWGVQAQLFNYASITNHSYAGSFSLLFIGYFSFGCMCLAFARRFLKHTLALLFTLTILLNPFFLTCAVTYKDDIAFATFSLFGVYLLRRYLFSKNLLLWFGFLGIALTTSKVFFPVALVTIVLYSILQNPHKLKFHASLAFSLLLGTSLVWITNHERISEYSAVISNYPGPHSLKLKVGGFLGAAPNEMGLEMRVNATDTQPVIDLTQAENKVDNSLKTFLWKNNSIATFKWFSQPTHNSGLFYYGYSFPSFFLLLVALGFIPLLKERQVTLFTCYGLGFLLLFLSLYPNPNSSNLRYLYGPLVVFSLLGLITLSRFNKKLAYGVTGILAVSSLYMAAWFLSHPTFTQSWAYAFKNKSFPSAFEVVSLNPVFEHQKQASKITPDMGTRIKTLVTQNEFLVSAPLYPGFSVYSAFTYPNSVTVFETYATADSVKGLMRPGIVSSLLKKNKYPVALLAGTWNIQTGNLLPAESIQAVPENYVVAYNIGPNQVHILAHKSTLPNLQGTPIIEK